MSTTVLDIVQYMLRLTKGTPVNNIGDTQQSAVYAEIVREVYDELVVEFDLQAAHSLFQLEASGDANLPTIMQVPAANHSIEWIKYDKRITSGGDPAFGPVFYKETSDFIETMYLLKASSTNVISYSLAGVSLYARTDGPPLYWTSFDGRTIVFDSYTSSLEATLQSSKTACYGQNLLTLAVDDTTPVNLPEKYIPYLKQESLARAENGFLDGGVSVKTEQAARRQRVRLQRLRRIDRTNNEESEKLVHYGRK